MIVGLTGNFGMGKSTVARCFKEKGAFILDSDRIAHEAFKKSHPVYPEIRRLFGRMEGALDRKKIAAVVFRDSKKRRALESVIHPYVFGRIEEEAAKSRRPVVIVEVPLLFESGFDRRCDRKIVVECDREKVFERLGRKGVRPAEIERRWKAQGPVPEKIGRADYLIDNSKSLAATRRQVSRIWKEFKTLALSNRERSL
ncbi:MAG: dephospho-CoA kinase [Candidatus Omnitrophica bacterium]|nr:dephospho-CoA kinase [Candidatus Omnitrophota bacterium]